MALNELIEYLESFIKSSSQLNPDCALLCDARRLIETAKRYKLAGIK